MKQLSKLLVILSEIPQNDERNLPGNEILAVDNQSIAKAVKKNTSDNEVFSRFIEDQNEASSTTVFGQEVKIKKGRHNLPNVKPPLDLFHTRNTSNAE